MPPGVRRGGVAGASRRLSPGNRLRRSVLPAVPRVARVPRPPGRAGTWLHLPGRLASFRARGLRGHTAPASAGVGWRGLLPARWRGVSSERRRPISCATTPPPGTRAQSGASAPASPPRFGVPGGASAPASPPRFGVPGSIGRRLRASQPAALRRPRGRLRASQPAALRRPKGRLRASRPVALRRPKGCRLHADCPIRATSDPMTWAASASGRLVRQSAWAPGPRQASRSRGPARASAPSRTAAASRRASPGGTPPQRSTVRRLHRVLGHDALVGVEVGVPGVREVLDRVLADADARQARRVERRAVGAARAAGSSPPSRPSRRGPRRAQARRAGRPRPPPGRTRSCRVRGRCPSRC